MHKNGGVTLDTLAFIHNYEKILRSRKIPKMVFYKECGISDAAVSQWRKGKTKPALSTVDKIAEYLGVSPDELLTGETKKAPSEESATKENIPSFDEDEMLAKFKSLYLKLTPELRPIVNTYLQKLLMIQELEIDSDSSDIGRG